MKLKGEHLCTVRLCTRSIISVSHKKIQDYRKTITVVSRNSPVVPNRQANHGMKVLQ